MKKQILKWKGLLLIMLAISLISLSGCSSDDIDNIQDKLDEELDGFALFIDGPIALPAGNSAQYNAVFLSVLNGETSTSVEWSVTGLSGESGIASITSGGVLSTSGAGLVKVTGKASDTDGNVYTASLPVSIDVPGAFVVNPGAIVSATDEDPIQLESIYLGLSSQSLTLNYESSNTQVVKVSDAGLVTFVGIGEAIIIVKASGVSGSPTQQIPVLVIKAPNIPLPVAKVVIEPKSQTLFPGETQKFEASVFDGDGNAVTDKEVEWKLIFEEDEEGEEIVVGSISNDGTFEAEYFGDAQLVASVEGVSDVATIFVIPENVIIVDPLLASLSSGSSKQFTATAYPMNKETVTLSETPLEDQPVIEWVMADFGIPEFSIGSVDADGKVTIKEDALEGFFGFLAALPKNESIKYYPGFSLITVAIASECECGEADPDAQSIEVDPNELNFSLFSGDLTKSLTASVLDEAGEVINDAVIGFCSDNELVASVDEDGEVTSMSEGKATITVCHGDLTKEISVTVSF